MFHYQDEWSEGAVRRFISRVGVEHIEDLFDLRRGDQYGMQGKEVNRDSLAMLRTRIDQVLRDQDATSIKDLAVNGNILCTEGNIPKGPDMGTVLDYLLEAVMDDPSLNTEEKLLELAQNFYRNYIVRRPNDQTDEIVPKGN